MTRARGDLGMNVSIVRHLLEVHGANVRVRRIERGSKFIVSLPLRVVDDVRHKTSTAPETPMGR